MRFLPSLIALGLATPALAQLQPAKDLVGQELEPAPVGTLPDHRSNVLILVADDIGVDMLRIYGEGSDLPKTSVLDSLARGGLLFRNAWSNPACSPTRATIQTGRHALRTGIGSIVEPLPDFTGLPLEEVTLPEMLDLGTNGAYAHAAIGKWHLGETADLGAEMAPNMAGYGHFEGSLANLGNYFDWTKVTNGVSEQSSTYATTDQVDSALAWIQQQSEPWMCYVSFSSAHTPWHAPPASLHSEDLTGADPVSNPRPLYKAMVQALDMEIGRLLNALGDEVLAETTIIFVGDNGTGEPLTVPPFDPDHAKGTLYEGGINVPLIVWGDRIPVVGLECEALVSTADIFATVAEIAGVDLEETLPGVELDSVSLVPYLADPERESIRKYLIAESFFPNGGASGYPVLNRLADFVCQADVGFQGPGTPQLSLCGNILAVGNNAELTLSGAPPNSTAVLLESWFFNPTPTAGGLITPVPTILETVHTTDALGGLTLPVAMAGADLSIFMQMAIADGTQPDGFVITNTVRADHQPRNRKAIRNERYKLMVSLNGGPEEFYDLEADPFEQIDLLSVGKPPLSPKQEQQLASLRATMDRFLATPQ